MQISRVKPVIRERKPGGSREGAGREGGREGGRERGGREGREGGSEGGREGGREGWNEPERSRTTPGNHLVLYIIYLGTDTLVFVSAFSSI